MTSRFRKCTKCHVNIPIDDVLVTGKCTVCGQAMQIEAEEEAVEVPAKAVVKRKRWVTLTSKRGRTYYHNSETGEDTWVKPADLEAEAMDDPFVPFKNDAVKNALMREQVKQDATKMGLPMEVIASMQQAQMQVEEQEDPLAMLQQQKNTAAVAKDTDQASSSEDSDDNEQAHHEIAATEKEAGGSGTSCLLM